MNHTFPQSFYPSYVEGSGQQLAAQIQPTTLACAYYPNFLLAWRPAQQPTEQGHHRHEVAPTYVPPRPLQITYIETMQPHQQMSRLEALPPPPNQLQLLQTSQPPKLEPHPNNQIGPHTPLPTIGMILPIAGGSSMEFQTKKQ